MQPSPDTKDVHAALPRETLWKATKTLGWHRAAKPNLAIPLYEAFRQKLEDLLGRTIPTGVFGADMQVGLVNDGPVTLIIDSKLRE